MIILGGVLAASLALMTGCDRNAGQNSRNDQHAQIAGASRQLPNEVIPPRCSSFASSSEHDQYPFRYGVGFIVAEPAASGLSSRACRTNGFGFNRFLVRNGGWLNEYDLSAKKKIDDLEPIDGFLVVVLGIVDRQSVPASTDLSVIGRPQTFTGVPLTKWTATAAEIEAFNKANPSRNTTSSPAWSINDTVDVRTGQPIHLGCIAPAGSSLAGDYLYTATFNTKVDQGQSSCTMWFSVDLGDIGLAVVKVMGFHPSNAPTVVDKVSQELKQRIRKFGT
ncbi:ribosomal protein L13E [Inhella inkyongensis]|uniref:Ribosomal protein L13E n=1 Tax=Inhella inkyongensis TaxID=392593 RepID=A0A840S2D5_9BURK|nr:hypothetical protein [Inhella inkyongensis]MBB5205347.1 ribosomal protein L13E [Inhella inkyongensis]